MFSAWALALLLVGWLLSVCVHEFGHAVVAYWGGDYTVKEKGYLTFNPLKYTHPLMSIVFPTIFVLMGGIPLPGGAVYIRRDLLKSKGWEVGMSLAGPGGTLVFMLLAMIPFWTGLADVEAHRGLWAPWAFLVYLQGYALILNLLPIPPLDGFQTLATLTMTEEQRQQILQHSLMILIVFFILITRVDAVGDALFTASIAISDILGLDRSLIRDGWDMISWR
jgi:Zn-dependent protease